MKNIINDASVNEWFAQQMASLTPMKMVLALLMGFIVGLIIALVYRKAFRGVLFSPSFANTLIMLCMITTPVVMCIKSNIALSMGMVGALSIVRFRTAVKDPLDTAYMFWSLTMGILLGAELYTIALVVDAGISIAMLALAFFRLRTPNTFLLVTHYDAEVEPEVMDFIRRIKVQRLRSKTVTPGGVELTVAVQLGERSDIVNRMLDIEGVHNATLIACLDRLFHSTSFDKSMKVGASVVCARRGGCSATFDELNKFFTISNMPIASSRYWNSIHGCEKGEAEMDEEGKQTMRMLAKNMTFLMKSIELGKKEYGLPEQEERTATNFIR